MEVKCQQALYCRLAPSRVKKETHIDSVYNGRPFVGIGSMLPFDVWTTISWTKPRRHLAAVENPEEEGLKPLAKFGWFLAVLLMVAVRAMAYRPPPLSPQDQKVLRDNFALSISIHKGASTENVCVCSDGQKVPVRGASGRVDIGCKNPLFCAAFRAPWAEALAKKGLYIANIFSRDLYLWDSFPDHNNLVRGYILEKYFTETNPNHKLSQLRAFGGLSGSEYETGASARFFERYLTAPEFNDTRNFLLAYELQKRFFLHA